MLFVGLSCSNIKSSNMTLNLFSLVRYFMGCVIVHFISTVNVFGWITGIDYCRSNPCVKGECSNVRGEPGYKCTCNPGYTGVNCGEGEERK